MVGAVTSLSVNNGWHLPANSPGEDDIVSLPILVGSMTIGSAWVELMDIKRVPVWRVLALAKVEAVTETSISIEVVGPSCQYKATSIMNMRMPKNLSLRTTVSTWAT
jgi:hypothetical protein